MSAGAEHPAPHRGRAGPGVLVGGAMAGPGAWILQLVAAYGVSSFTCSPHGKPNEGAVPAWPEHGILLGLNIACLGVAIVGGLIALRSWNRTKLEKPGGGHRLLNTGEGRTRFLAACGVLSAAGFAVAILFNTAEFLTVPVCWGSPS